MTPPFTPQVTSPAEPGLAALLATRDVPCPGCGYNLRGVTGKACPECGAALSVAALFDHARRARPTPQGPWLILLLPPMLGLFETISSWRRVVDCLMHGQWPLSEMGLSVGGESWLSQALALRLASIAYWHCLLPALVAMLLARRRFLALPRWLQWALAGAALLAATIAHRREISFATGTYYFWWW